MDMIEQALGELNAPMVLDVATGSGSMARHLRDSYQGLGTILASDISYDVLARSRESLGSIRDLVTVCMDSALLALKEECFHLAVISNSLHHLENPVQTLKEMMRVLLPGGYLLIREMYRDRQSETQMTHVLMHDWWAAIDTLGGIPHFRTFTRADILGRIDTLELSDTVVRDISHIDHDPLDPELGKSLNRAIDAYLEKLEDRGDGEELLRQGEVLRERVRKVGFHGAASLLVLGRKPSGSATGGK